MNRVIVILAVISVAQTAVYSDIQEIKPGQPYACRGDNGKTYQPGTQWNPEGRCEKVECSAHSANQVKLVGASCGLISVPKGWKTVSDMKKNYPDCCPYPVKP